MNVGGPSQSQSTQASRASTVATPATATPTTAATTATTPAAEVRAPADAATVEGSRARAAGVEEAAKARVLNAAEAPAAATQGPARGLLHDIKSRGSGKGINNEPGTKNCLIQEAETVTDAASLLQDIAKKGSGKQISDDGSDCAPITNSNTMTIA